MVKTLENLCRQIRDVKLYLNERDGEENCSFASSFNEASVYSITLASHIIHIVCSTYFLLTYNI